MCVKTLDCLQVVVVSSPTLISQLITTCFYLKYLSNPLSRTCLMVVSTSQHLLPFLGGALPFPSFTGRTVWLELLAWDIVAGQLGTCCPSPCVKKCDGGLEVALEMKMLFSSWH